MTAKRTRARSVRSNPSRARSRTPSPLGEKSLRLRGEAEHERELALQLLRDEEGGDRRHNKQGEYRPDQGPGHGARKPRRTENVGHAGSDHRPLGRRRPVRPRAGRRAGALAGPTWSSSRRASFTVRRPNPGLLRAPRLLPPGHPPGRRSAPRGGGRCGWPATCRARSGPARANGGGRPPSPVVPASAARLAAARTGAAAGHDAAQRPAGRAPGAPAAGPHGRRGGAHPRGRARC